MLSLIPFLFMRKRSKSVEPQISAVVLGNLKLPTPESRFTEYADSIGATRQAFAPLMNRLITGSLTATEFVRMLVLECKNEGIQVPSGKASLQILKDASDLKYNEEILTIAKKLRMNGIRVGAVVENWVEDRDEYKDENAIFFSKLRSYFDVVVESSKVGLRTSDVDIYKHACDRLETETSKAIVMGVDGVFLQEGQQLEFQQIIEGGNVDKLITEIRNSLKFEIIPETDKLYPPPCLPDEVPHAFAEVQPGIKLHYVDVGTGPVVMLFHGFPAMWYGWRYQIHALCDAGYRVIAMDQRGYGESSCPANISSYKHDELCKDAIGLMNCLKIPLCYIFGHAAIIWNLALKYPDRIKGAGCLNTPFICHEGIEERNKNMHLFSFQRYFQTPGVAEREFGANLRKTINTLLGDYPCEDGYGNIEKQGGALVTVRDDIKSNYLTEYDIEYYVQQFSISGFRGPVNYYKNLRENAMWKKQTPHRKILCPALLITTGSDKIVLPEFSKGMEKEVPNLTREHLPTCGHWAMIEEPDKFNEILINWLGKCSAKQ